MTLQKTMSDAAIIANRENAAKSTGPKTDAGKEAVRNNALKHGLISRSLTFENEEDRLEFDALCTELQCDLAPQGVLEKMIVNDIALSWWKLLTVSRLQVQELDARQSKAAEILNALGKDAQQMDSYFLSKPQAITTSASGWECREVSLRKQTSNSKENSTQYVGDQEGSGTVVFEAKLGSSADNLVRYENLWKKNFYKAINSLREIQADRLGVSKESAILQNKPKR